MDSNPRSSGFAIGEKRALRRLTFHITFLVVIGGTHALCLAQSGQANVNDKRISETADKSVSRALTDAQIAQDTRSHIDELIAADRFSGDVLLAKNGKILFERAYGFADHTFNVRNTLNTKFNLASMGKMFTAVSMLQLVQEGRLGLDDNLIKILPDYPDKDIAHKVTIRELLTHTAGYGSYFNKRFESSSRADFRELQDYLSLITGQPLLFEPGTRWSYSNSGFIILGLVIEKVSGQSYFDYVREHVFKPAGMANTDNYDEDDDVPNLAVGYTTSGTHPKAYAAGPRRSNIFMMASRGASAGGAYSTVGDIFRFSQAVQEHRLLNAEYTKMLTTGEVATTRAPEVKYAFGMFDSRVNGVRIVGHSGGSPGMSTILDMYPDLGYTVVVLSNYDNGALVVNDRIRWELTGHTLPRAVHLPSKVLRELAGNYATVPPKAGMTHLPIEIAMDQDKGLWITMGQTKHKALPLSSEEFFDDDAPNVRYRFTRGVAGEVIGFSLTGGVGSTAPVPMSATKVD